MTRINRDMVVDVKKVDADAHTVAKEHDRVLKEMEDLRAWLAESKKAKDALETRLGESDRARADAEKVRADAEKAQVNVEALSKATKVSLQESERAYQGLKLRYEHWKAKAFWAMKQLSFVPWLQDIACAWGFNWGLKPLGPWS
jgi:chaperonin cofactor prefoldin